MRKALLVDVTEKKNKQYAQASEISPADRIEYLIELIRLARHFNKNRKVASYPPDWAIYTLHPKK
jgi:hypothetical protein